TVVNNIVDIVLFTEFPLMENCVPVALRKNGQMNYVTEVLVTGFQLLESRAQRAMRENNADQDLADLVLEEEELPF
ncbi:hypothetical protein PNI0009_02122, partial [Streptococcus pneumoniae PNI0009]